MIVVPCEQTAGERTGLFAAGAEIVERIEAIADTRDRDPPFEVIQVVRNYEVVGNRVGRAECAEGIGVGRSHWLLLLMDPFSRGIPE